MKYIPKAILCAIIGFIIWFVIATVLGLLIAFLGVKIPIFARFLLWLEDSLVFGHLVPVIFRGIPCLLPGYVIAKICHDDITQRTVSLAVLFCIITGIQLYSLIFLDQGSTWWMIQGTIGQAIGLFMFRSIPNL